MADAPIELLHGWLSQTLPKAAIQPGIRFTYRGDGISSATRSWDEEVVKEKLLLLADVRWEGGLDFVTVWYESGTHAATATEFADEISRAMDGLAVRRLIRSTGSMSIPLTQPANAQHRQPDGSWGARAGPTMPSVLFEMAYSQTLAQGRDKVENEYFPTGHVTRCIIMSILPPRSPPPPPLPAVDPPVRIRIEQWILIHGVASPDHSQLHAHLDWVEGGPAVAQPLNLPLLDFFRPGQPPAPPLLPPTLQTHAQLANAMVSVPAGALQTIFSDAAALHHARF